MRWILLPVAVLGTTSSAQAAEGEEIKGVEVGARLGYQLPAGEFAKGRKMSEEFGSGALVGLDAGYRLNRLFYAGLTLAYVPSLDVKVCPDCSASALRPGVFVRIHPTAQFEPIDPWIGVGVGYDRLSVQSKYFDSVSRTTVDRTDAVTGAEFLNLSLGADYRILPALSVNAFLSYSLARYTRSADTDVVDPAIHNWIVVGLGGRYRL